MKLRTLFQTASTIAATWMVSGQVIAGSTATIPEPDILALFGLGAAAMAAVAIRKNRNKK